MTRMLYLECAAGISGDMIVAALLDVGASEQAVLRALRSLPVDGFDVRISRVAKSGLDACDFDVVLDAAHENHDHDMAYLHGARGHGCAGEGEGGGAHGLERGRDHGCDHRLIHAHSDEGGCAHAHGDEHEHGCDHDRERAHTSEGGDHRCAHAHHEHRGLRDIEAIVDAADMGEGARRIAQRTFRILAEAEAKAHGVPVEEVHFHEVGAVDSIADVVAASAALDSLGVDDVIVVELCEGRGSVRCQHGIMPVPVPATLNIAQEHGIALRILDVQGELVTPTGAAFAAAVRTLDALPERFTVRGVGLGAGKRDYATSGVLRAMIVEPA